MKLSLVKNLERNIFAASLNSVVKLLFPFLNRTLFLWLLGPAYLGLNGLFGSLLGVLMLAELGFGTAVVCSMYKPVADDDRSLLCAYLQFYRTVYRWVGIVILTIGLLLLPFLRHLVHGRIPPDVDLHILYLIHLVNTVLSYLLFAYRGSVLSAYHRQDVLTNIRTMVSIAQYCAVFLILLLTRNYYFYVIATVCFTIVQNLLIRHESKRLFPDIEPRGKLPAHLRQKVKSDVESIFMHKIGGVISYSFGNLIISAFLGLVAVAAYGNYFYVYTSVAGIVWIVYHSMTSGFGNRIYTETREKNYELFLKFNRLVGVVIIWCAAMMSALYQPFLSEWTKGNTLLVRHALTPILMILFFYLTQSRQVLLTFKAAASLWSQDRWKPIVAGAVNISMAIPMVILLPNDFKLDGVIAATVISMGLIQMPWESHVLFTAFFHPSQARQYWRLQATCALQALGLCLLTWGSTKLIPLTGIPGLLAKGAIAAAVSCGILMLFYRQYVMEIWNIVRKKN